MGGGISLMQVLMSEKAATLVNLTNLPANRESDTEIRKRGYAAPRAAQVKTIYEVETFFFHAPYIQLEQTHAVQIIHEDSKKRYRGRMECRFWSTFATHCDNLEKRLDLP
jgi:hypothetical protein